jgi:hypothetical protein
MSDGRDEVTDRVASRFDTDNESDGEEQSSDTTQAEKETSGSSAANSHRAKNVKKAWNAKSIYLTDDLDSRLSKAYKRLDLELDDEVDQFKKTRHFYPLVVSAGLERLEKMKRNEVLESMERIENND